MILSLGLTGFDRLIGSEIKLIQPGKAIFTLHVQERHCNPMGTLHGGLLMTLADTAAGCACSYEPCVCPTVEGKLNFLLPCFNGDTITVEGNELRHGKQLLSCEVRAFNQEGKLVACGLYTYLVSHKPLPNHQPGS